MKSLLLPALIILLGSAVLAQEPVFLNDFSAQGADAFPFDPEVEGITVNNQLLFIADDGKHGEELWRTNGTAVGTQLLKDINPDENASNINFIATIGNILFFSANDEEHGSELWTTQGTASSTQMVKDINPGAPHGSPAQGVVLNEILYFSARGEKGRELYRSAGTEATTVLVKDINPNTLSTGTPYSGSPSRLTVVGNSIFFVANDGDHGVELWKTNGTTGGTVMLKDINEGASSTSFFDLKGGDDLLYFTANDGVHGRELWISDGTEGGTKMVKDITEGSGSSNVTFMEEVNGIFYFIVRESNLERNLWKTDGTEAGTTIVQDGINTREFTLFNDQLFFKGNNRLWRADGSTEEQISDQGIGEWLAATNDFLYFVASESGSGNGIWKTDGTSEGVTLVKEITSRSYRYIQYLTAVGNRVYFTAETEEFGNEIWTSDGAAEGTYLLIDMVPGEESGYETYRDVKFAATGDIMFFAGWDEEHGWELWKTDGTTEGTSLVKDINAQSQDIRLSGDLIPYKDHVYFITYDDGIWKTDGSPENTELIQEAAYPTGLNLVNDKLLFTAASSELSRTIWVSDGTAEGTQPLFDAETMPGSIFLFQHNLPQINGSLFFSGRDNEHGSELWKTDGTAEGTSLVKDIYEGEAPSFYSFSSGDYIVIDDVLYFVANDEVLGTELWKSDGTEAGTVPVSDINPFGSSYVSYLTESNGEIFFTANDGTAGYELWKTDGTTDGTVIIKDIYPGAENGVRFNPLISFQGSVYFAAEDGEHGRELWKSDGTEEGTVLLKDINPGSSRSNPTSFSVVGNTLYFRAIDESGLKIWKTDGTAEGTEPFLNLEASYFTKVNEVEGTLFFTVNDGDHGFELWRMGRGSENPILTSDINPGSSDALPDVLGYYNGSLYFTALDPEHGRELWTLTPLELQAALETKQNTLCEPGEPVTFTASAEEGFDPEYLWYVNDELVADQNSDTFTANDLNEGDEVKVMALAGEEAWVKEDSVFSEIITISFSLPEAEIVISGNTLTASEGASYRWFLDGEPLSDDTRSITVQQSGGYRVEVTNELGCSALSTLLTFTVTGIADEKLAGGLKMYPNPAVSQLLIDSQVNEYLRLLIYDMNGKKMYESALAPLEARHQIPLQDLANGQYVVKFIGKEGVYQLKLMKL